MFYTLGRAATYEKDLAEEAAKGLPSLKGIGGWALRLEYAIKYKKELLTEEGAKKWDLPQGVYNIYELPECTENIVDFKNPEDSVLKEETLIGRRVWAEECPSCGESVEVGNFMAWGAGRCSGCGNQWWWDSNPDDDGPPAIVCWASSEK